MMNADACLVSHQPMVENFGMTTGTFTGKVRRCKKEMFEPTPMYKKMSNKWKIKPTADEIPRQRRGSESTPVPTLEECLINFNLPCTICKEIELCRCLLSEPVPVPRPRKFSSCPSSPVVRHVPYRRASLGRLEEDLSDSNKLPSFRDLFGTIGENTYDNVKINNVLNSSPSEESKLLNTLTTRFLHFQLSQQPTSSAK